ncbi:MAG: hypothetical protein D6731_11820 [Planctomycetota bacterium]|nr:MAG: hypothetical protein D6731_11820 [Planctomycetota bacterium]
MKSAPSAPRFVRDRDAPGRLRAEARGREPSAPAPFGASRAAAPFGCGVLLGVLALVLAPAGSAGAQEPGPVRYDLRPRYRLGDRQETEARLALLLHLRLRLATQKIDRTSEQETVVFRRTRDEVISVAEGHVEAVRRAFVSAWSGLREPGAPRLTRSFDPLHRTVVVVRVDDDGRPRARLERGEAPRSALRGELLTERYEAALPTRPVAVGEEWSVEGAAFRQVLGRSLGDDVEGALHCSLREVREEALSPAEESERYAVVALRCEARGRRGEGPEAAILSADLEGSLRFSLRRHKIATVSLRGTARLEQVRSEGEHTLELRGEGPLEIKKRTWFPRKPRRPPAAREH